MAKEVQMSIKIERDLRDEFSRAAAAVHRPASQVMRELMRGFVQRAYEPNAETIAAMEETDRGEGIAFDSVEDLCRDLGIPCES